MKEERRRFNLALIPNFEKINGNNNELQTDSILKLKAAFFHTYGSRNIPFSLRLFFFKTFVL